MNCLHALGFFSAAVPWHARLAQWLGDLVLRTMVLRVRRSHRSITVYGEDVRTVDDVVEAVRGLERDAPLEARRLRRQVSVVLLAGAGLSFTPLSRALTLPEECPSRSLREYELVYQATRAWLMSVAHLAPDSPARSRLHHEIGTRAALRCLTRLRRVRQDVPSDEQVLAHVGDDGGSAR